MNLFVISTLCFSFFAFLLGLIIYLKRRDSIGGIWFAFNLFCSIWGLGYAFQINNDVPYDQALLMTRIGDAAALLIPVTWLHFIFAFLQLKRKLIIGFLYGVSILILLTSPTTLFIESLKNKSNIGIVHFAEGGISFHIFSFIFVAVVILGFCTLIRFFLKKKTAPERKKQILYLIIAPILGFSGGTTAFLPVYDIDIPILYGTVLLPLFPCLMALAFSRYQLLDVDMIAQAAHRDKLAAIGTLATSINHEVRNPLYIVQGYAQSYLTNIKEGIYQNKDDALEKASEAFKKTIDQTQRAMDIVKQFSSFAKQGLDDALRPEILNFSEITKGVLPLVQHELENDQIKLILNIPKDLPSIQADRRQVEQILFNLIVNACQALKSHGQGMIEISGEKNANGVSIKISDNGPGISEQQLKQIFEPFYTTKEEGTGLGLYVTKQLVEKNNGKITSKSRIGKGTTFTITFS